MQVKRWSLLTKDKHQDTSTLSSATQGLHWPELSYHHLISSSSTFPMHLAHGVYHMLHAFR